MGKRTKTKMSGLVCHATPNFFAKSKETVLYEKFQKGVITEKELREYSDILSSQKKEFTQVKVWGNWYNLSKFNKSAEEFIKEGFQVR